MVLSNIEKLLIKYEKGETTIKEEQRLKSYFSKKTIAPHLEIYKPMFSYFLLNKQDQYTKHIPLKDKRVFNYKWISVAAVAVIIIGIYFKITYNKTNDLGTYNDPQTAYNEVAKQLAMISNHFNKGAETLNYLNELEKSTNIIFKPIHKKIKQK